MYDTGYVSDLIWVPKDQIDLDTVRDRFTHVPRFKNLQPIPNYKEEGELIGFPRNSHIRVVNLEDRKSYGAYPVSVRFTKELRDYQVPVINDFAKRLSQGETDLIIEADTGSGKTVMLNKIWTLLGVPLLVVVPKTDLIDQWIEALLTFTDIREDQIGLVRQSKCEYEGKAVSLAMLHSLCKDKYPEEFKQHYGAVFFDELHKLGAPYFSVVGGMFPARFRIGATATLKRQDGMESVFYEHLGRRIVTLSKSTQPVPTVARVEYPRSSGYVPYFKGVDATVKARVLGAFLKHKVKGAEKAVSNAFLQHDWEARTDSLMALCGGNGKLEATVRHILRLNDVYMRAKLFSLLSDNKHRNQQIAHYANVLAKSKRQTLVIGDRIPQLEAIHDILTQTYGYPEKEIGLYLGRTKKKERERIASECSIILATMKMMDIGTDIDTLRGLVFATPVAEITQVVGRIRRINPELPEPFVVDFVDTKYKAALRWASRRMRFYRKVKAIVHEAE